MTLPQANNLLEKQLHAEIRRILQLLERTRRTRRRARRLVSLETGVLHQKTRTRSGGVRHPAGRHPANR
jgi:hypothetical protein